MCNSRSLAVCLLGLSFPLAGALGGCSAGGLSATSDGPLGESADLGEAPDLAPAPEVPDLGYPLRDAAFHPVGPNVVSHGGKRFGALDLVGVEWAGDTQTDARTTFLNGLLESPYFALLAEYGLDPKKAIFHGMFLLSSTIPTTLDDTAVPALLRDRIAAGELPAPAVDTVYLIYLNRKTQSTMAGEAGCMAYGGYHHWAAPLRGQPGLTYAIIPACGRGGGQQAFDNETVVVSHELVETVSDPGGSGYLDTSLPLGEIGDICDPLSAHISVTLPNMSVQSYWVTRYYSAKNALDGTKDPCVPEPAAPYFYFGAAPSDQYLNVQIGDTGDGTATFQVMPFAMGDVGVINWQIHVDGVFSIFFDPPSGSGLPGTTQDVTVHVNSNTMPGSYPLFIMSSVTTPSQHRNVWYGSLSVQ
jgi:hypothetical protein